MGKADEGAHFFDLAMHCRSSFKSGFRETRLLSGYLLENGRYAELDSLLLPLLNSEKLSHNILHEQDHLMKVYIRSLYKRGLYKEASVWVERYMDLTLRLFQENGQRSIEEFNYAYQAELQKMEIVKQQHEMTIYRTWFLVLIVGMILLLVYILSVIYLLRKQKRDNLFLSNQVQELNIEREKMTKLLTSLTALHSEQGTKADVSDNELTVQKIHDYLKTDNRFLDKELTIDTIQRECGVSYDSLNKRFNAVLGMSCIDYLNYLRLDYASRLLLNSNLTVEAIADESGFNSTRTFQRQFKEKYNISPSQFRKVKK